MKVVAQPVRITGYATGFLDDIQDVHDAKVKTFKKGVMTLTFGGIAGPSGENHVTLDLPKADAGAFVLNRRYRLCYDPERSGVVLKIYEMQDGGMNLVWSPEVSRQNREREEALARQARELIQKAS